MTWPTNDSPFWGWLKSTTLIVSAMVAVSFGYREGFVATADIPVILAFVLPYLGITGTQALLAPKKNRKR